MSERNVLENTCAFFIKSPLRQAGALTLITLRGARSLFLTSLLASIAIAQNVVPGTNQPIKISYGCVDDDLQQAGLLCTEQEPCAIFLELTAISPEGRKLFIAGNLHATSGTLSTVLMMSDDGGLTWKEPAARVRAAALEQLQFYDLEHGWAAGETQYPLPRDPFFLITSDGGNSWKERPVTEEGGPGSILRFWFDSAQHGELIVDAGKRAPAGRYHAYESETSGESWMIRGMTGEVPRLRHTSNSFDSPDFRIRAAGKSYSIEKRNGESWEPIASFAIEVASCAIKPPVVKEPDPQ